MNFVVTGLSPVPFTHLFGLSSDELSQHGVTRYTAEEDSGFPDRIEMRDVSAGETVLLVNHVSIPEDTPYKASHAIFVREGATHAYRATNIIPDVMYKRLLSLRAFDAHGMMLDGDIGQGEQITEVITRFFQDPKVAYIHAHNARRGCYSGRIDRE